eukprot:9545447-Alexandrium_andersonii.AAC.1
MAVMCVVIICFSGALACAGGFFAARRAFRERRCIMDTEAETARAERESAAFAPSAPPPPPRQHSGP